jgi:hypothetical protein
MRAYQTEGEKTMTKVYMTVMVEESQKATLEEIARLTREPGERQNLSKLARKAFSLFIEQWQKKVAALNESV